MSEFTKLVGVTGTAGDVEPSLANKISIGLRLREIFKQRNPRPYYQQILIGYSSSANFTGNITPTFIMLYYKLLFNQAFTKQLISKMNLDSEEKELRYVCEYLTMNHPFNNLFDFFFKIYPIEKMKSVLNFDFFLSRYSKIFVAQFQPRLDKVLKKKKVLFV